MNLSNDDILVIICLLSIAMNGFLCIVIGRLRDQLIEVRSNQIEKFQHSFNSLDPFGVYGGTVMTPDDIEAEEKEELEYLDEMGYLYNVGAESSLPKVATGTPMPKVKPPKE